MQLNVLLAAWSQSTESGYQADRCTRKEPAPNPGMVSIYAGHRLVGAPRRNRTGDPILTMEPPGTAVRTARYRRSRPTVGAKVMGSPSAKGCAHFSVILFASERLSNHLIGQYRFPSTTAARSGGRHQSAEQYGSSAHRRTAASAAPRTAAPSTSTRTGGIPRSGHTQTKARGPGGGRGRTR
jgi:hypothetical protein